MTKLKVLELFAGIGACSKALERLEIPHEIVDAVEIDKFAIKSFNAIHGTNFEPQDITTWDKDIKCDLIMHGSPCQDFSVAGKQAGGDKDSGTRSSLMYETLRIVKKLKPKYVIWENVKNLISKKHQHNYFAYIKAMADLGYKSYGRVLNAKEFGVPQNRERVFTVSILGGGDFEFPEPFPLEKKLKDVLEDEADEKYYLSEGRLKAIQTWEDRQRENGRGFRFEVKDGNSIGRSITTSGDRPSSTNYVVEPQPVKRRRSEFGKKVRKAYENHKISHSESMKEFYIAKDGVMPTLTSSKREQKIFVPYRIRKLTPKECWRLMGFDDSDFEKAEKVNSNTQLYKQAGNSIVVNVLEAILWELLKNEINITVVKNTTKNRGEVYG